MTRPRRRNFQPDEKVRILREHLIEGRAVSVVCDAFGLRPSEFYQWQAMLGSREHLDGGGIHLPQVTTTSSVEQWRLAPDSRVRASTTLGTASSSMTGTDLRRHAGGT
jgi:transposase-like protein